MIQVNEYYEGKVKSMGADIKEGKFTIGVMEAGEYEFGTATIEIMTVVSGEMKVQLPGENEFKAVKPFDSFRVEKDASFKLIIEETCAYRCQYL